MMSHPDASMLSDQNARAHEPLVNADVDDAASVSETDDVLSADDLNVHESDRTVLDDAEIQEELLGNPAPSQTRRALLSLRRGQQEGALKDEHRSKRSNRRARRRRQSTGVYGEETELMFEMEEGFKDTSSQSSVDSFDVDGVQWEEKSTRRKHGLQLALIHALIILLFGGLVFAAYKVSRKHPSAGPRIAVVSNGTHNFRPTTILISLDGFRADFLNRNITPALNAFIASGVSPKYMLPSFPSVTFPNHFTLVTGLYPESHGIVSNQFWDPALQQEFSYTDAEVSMQPKWWNAEPLWVTAEHQGVRSAIHMWPGSEAHIPDVEPSYLDKYNASEALSRKVDRVLQWLDLPGDDDDADSSLTDDRRPQFIAAYVPNVDADGHKYGPNSTEIRATIADVDSMLTMLVEGLYGRNLTEIVNIVIVSDHGMATTSTSRLIQLEDLIDTSLVDHVDGWPLRGLRLKHPDRDVPILYDQLLKKAEEMGTFDVYTLATMPERYHFSHNDRIAPLWIVPQTGWAVVEKPAFDVAEAQTIGRQFSPKGLHGYDHEHPLMRAIFVARGPAFPHQPNSRVPVFQNIEVYNIVCGSLGVTPRPNNGTLRLPLKPDGLHSDADEPILETPTDGEDDGENAHQDQATSGQDEATSEPDDVLRQGDQGPAQDGPAGDDPSASNTSWWDFLHNQLQKAKEWAKEFVDSIKNNKAQDGDPAMSK